VSPLFEQPWKAEVAGFRVARRRKEKKSGKFDAAVRFRSYVTSVLLNRSYGVRYFNK
jgi:hypothetical protein